MDETRRPMDQDYDAMIAAIERDPDSAVDALSAVCGPEPVGTPGDRYMGEHRA